MLDEKYSFRFDEEHFIIEPEYKTFFPNKNKDNQGPSYHQADVVDELNELYAVPNKGDKSAGGAKDNSASVSGDNQADDSGNHLATNSANMSSADSGEDSVDALYARVKKGDKSTDGAKDNSADVSGANPIDNFGNNLGTNAKNISPDDFGNDSVDALYARVKKGDKSTDGAKDNSADISGANPIDNFGNHLTANFETISAGDSGNDSVDALYARVKKGDKSTGGTNDNFTVVFRDDSCSFSWSNFASSQGDFSGCSTMNSATGPKHNLASSSSIATAEGFENNTYVFGNILVNMSGDNLVGSSGIKLTSGSGSHEIGGLGTSSGDSLTNGSIEKSARGLGDGLAVGSADDSADGSKDKSANVSAANEHGEDGNEGTFCDFGENMSSMYTTLENILNDLK
ncbi:uncharacterized protein DDB_G0290685-like [Gigantopelta aegis]|uniref:uncharacterized protein DDB_G0290685-like n=1 Tax=Gigantopelta aegis TaxID=1735272 RepID=UPI001B88B0D8|nr:uncharacterized protein DDB_G0290685-like [Gigantopelta aegis]